MGYLGKKAVLAAGASFVFVAVSTTLLPGTANAQNCTAQAGQIDGGTGAATVDTCGSTNQLLSACNGLDAIGASPDTIYSLQWAAGAQTMSIAATPTGYDLKLALLQTTCSAGATCIRDSDNGGIGQAESFSMGGLPAGGYYVLLTSFGGSPDCGSTAITVMGLPVTLQQFSVE
ncbi:MAG TPA: hypothetical protein VLF18_13390 [Tahibacter sp.]|uniref:hypothetical protein n=1 Tax=Tahibacter sp. TaxID=2056211 RepID=UPI002B956125|nr:hypothetical protein [Tahibacter sp.]HSX61189.1 hypothetical protein [Tahibacter sp.]